MCGPRWLTACVPALLALLGPAAAPGQDCPRYFPLEPGSTWVYGDRDTYDHPLAARYEIAVLRRERDELIVRYQVFVPSIGFTLGPTEVLLREVEGGVDIEMPGEGFVPQYRFCQERFRRRHPWECFDLSAEIGPRDVAVAGIFEGFEGCLRVNFLPPLCADYGPTQEFWCPGVGMVVTWESQAEWALLSHTRAPSFVRGDANADGRVGLADAVFVLSYLFRDAATPPCLDAADSDDDGELELTDAVYLLGWLFRGTAPPPRPRAARSGEYGPERCGADNDPEADTLGCQAFAPCPQR